MTSEKEQPREDTALSTEEWKQKYAELEVLFTEKEADLHLKDRELEIEAALERVRTRTMAMHKSDELLEVIAIIAEQLKHLNFRYDNVSFAVRNQAHDYKFWLSAPGLSQPIYIHVPYINNPMFERVRDVQDNNLGIYTDILTTEESRQWHQHVFDNSELQNLPAKTKKYILDNGYARTIIMMPTIMLIIGNYVSKPYTKEENNVFKRFAGVFEQSYTRFLDLQKAEAQAREAQIEAALERVRSRTMGMHRSDELEDAATLLFQQIRDLGIKTWTTGFNVWLDGDNAYQDWLTTPEGGFIEPYIVDLTQYPVFMKIREAKLRGDEFYVGFEDEDTIKETYKHLMKYAPDQFGKLLKDGFQFPSQQYDHFVFGKKVSLLFITYEPVPEAHEIFKRFGKVFEQTYTRFLDLQKAEEQAREAQIEAALEKIRSKSLAMHQSDDLKEVVSILFEKLKELGLVFDGGAGVKTFKENSNDAVLWVAAPDHLSSPSIVNIPFEEKDILKNPMLYDVWKARESGTDIFNKSYSFKEKNEYFNFVYLNNDYNQIPQAVRDWVLQTPNYTGSEVFNHHTSVIINSYSGELITEKQFEILKRIGKVFEQAYIRFLDLQKAEAQARESQIQLALERVRARTMAMQNSNELAMAAQLLFQQFHALGIHTFTCAYMFIEEEKNLQRGWAVVPDGTLLPDFIDFPLSGDPILDDRYQSWKEKRPIHEAEIHGELNKQHHRFLASKVPHQFAKHIVSQLPERVLFYSAYFSQGYLFIVTTTPLSAEEKSIMIRFANVFEQTYTRFLDLQKAEEQAREAQIEASLERVRAKAMAMQSSKDIETATAVVFNELTRLGIDMERCGISIMNETPIFEVWSTLLSPKNKEVVNVISGHLDSRTHPMNHQFHQNWQEKKDYSYYKLAGDEVRKYYEILEKQPGYHFPKIARYPDDQIAHCFFFNEGAIFVYTKDELSAETKNIFQRFTKVFEQTYTRFLDIQKAEAQAREAEIEASLERVRAKAMAMHSSQDIETATEVVFNELTRLGIDMERCGIGILNETPIAEIWSTPLSPENKEVVNVITGQLDLRIHPLLQTFHQGWSDKKDFSTYKLIGDEVRKYYNKLEKQPGYNFPKIASYPNQQVVHNFYFKEGGIFVFTKDELSAETKNIFQRFAKVFEQTYTRFLDIQKAEAQAIEATKQASLDRVRGEIASMRSAGDLEIITPLVWRELTTLCISFIRCGVFIVHEEEQHVEVYLSKPDGTSLAVMHLPFGSSDLAVQTVNAWRKGNIFKQHWSKEEFLNWGRSMIEQGQIPDLDTYQGSEVPPESLFLHFIPFNQGMLYVGATEPLSGEEIDLAASLAETFSIAYARYEDFVKLEKAKAGIEEALAELKATQSQLVQQEKLASLGQLTAGIAHEIKNPLNFVNNFSDLSIELVEEVRDEVKEKLSADSYQLTAILDDIEGNLRKIHEHGSRADSIVKSMLQHSRGGSGKMEPADVNAVLKEFVNLAFHGMRASKNQINVDIELDLDDSIGKIPLITEDFSRVILNLCNNAFDAMREKLSAVSSQPSASYKPELTVRTKKQSDRVTVEIEDNGSGIPDEIRDKILQPFFTTKKGTDGTGLGLSITHDIVKAHRGELNIKSDGSGTIFQIIIPA